MKKLLILIVFVTMLAGCALPDKNAVENTCPYAVMIDDVTYYYTDAIQLDIDTENIEILGNITYCVPENQMPQKNGEANIDILGAPYAKYNDGMIVKIDEEWIFFEER